MFFILYFLVMFNESFDNVRPSEERTSRVAISEDMLKAVLNCYEYFCNNENRYVTLNETARALKLCDCSVELFQNFNSRDHEQFVQKTAPTVDVIYEKVKDILLERVINLLTDDLLFIICQKNLVLNFKKQIIERYLWRCPVKLLGDGNICKKLKNYKQKIMQLST